MSLKKCKKTNKQVWGKGHVVAASDVVAVSEESGRPTLNVFGKLKKINVWGKGHAVTVSSGEGCVLHDGAQRQAWEGGMRRKRKEELFHVGVGTAVLFSCLHLRGV